MAGIGTKPLRTATSGLARITAPLWLLAAGGCILFLRALYTDAHEVYASLELAPPTLLALALDAGSRLQTSAGLGLALGVVAASSVPGLVGRRGTRIALTYLVLAIAVTAFAGLVYYANTSALVQLHEQLAVPGGR